MPELSGLLACACPVARYIDDVIHWRVLLLFLMLFFSAHEVLSAIFFPLPLPRLFFVGIEAVFFFSTLVLSSVTAAGSYPFVLGLMAGLRCCASHGRIISIKGLAVNSGSPWILQAPNLHFSDAVVKARLAEG